MTLPPGASIPDGYRAMIKGEIVPMDCLIGTFPWGQASEHSKWQAPDSYDKIERVGKKFTDLSGCIVVPVGYNGIYNTRKPYTPSKWAEPLPLP